MQKLQEPDTNTLDQVDLSIKLREAAKIDYEQFDRKVQDACAAAAVLVQKCKQLEADGATAFCPKPVDIVKANAKALVDKWIKVMPNADQKRLGEKIVKAAAEDRKSGKAFSTARLESVVVSMVEELRQAARIELLSNANRTISSGPDGGTVMRLGKPVYGSRSRGTTTYGIYLCIAKFESAVAVILGDADPLTVKCAIEDEPLPGSLAGGWSIFPPKKRKEKTFPELRIWASRSEAVFETPEDAALVITECRTAATEYEAVQAAAAEAKKTDPYHVPWLRP